MIEVSMKMALLIYLGSVLLVFFGVWLLTHGKERRKQVLPPRHSFTICEYCHYGYLAITGISVSKCPQCSSFNRTKIH